MTRKTTAMCVAMAACLAMGVAGCEKSKPTDKPTTKAPEQGTTAAVIPASYFAASEPASAKGIDEIKKSAKVGDQVVLRGRIAGRVDPFTQGRAEFMMTDMTLPVCEDGCETPWDHCCDDAKTIASHAATVQLVGDDGQVIKASVKGVHGVAPNAELVVVGKVAKLDDAGNMVVDAKQVWVAGAK